MPADTRPTIRPGAVAHRHDGADRRAERARVHLGECLAAQGGFDGAEVVAADLVRIGVGEARSVGRHDRDERDVGVGADRLGDRLQNLVWPFRIRSPRPSTASRPARSRWRRPAGERRRRRPRRASSSARPLPPAPRLRSPRSAMRDRLGRQRTRPPAAHGRARGRPAWRRLGFEASSRSTMRHLR